MRPMILAELRMSILIHGEDPVTPLVYSTFVLSSHIQGILPIRFL